MMKIRVGEALRSLGVRRIVIGCGALVLGGIIVALLLPCFAGANNASRDQVAVPVAVFLDSLGINTHINFSGPEFTGYADTQRVAASLRYIGVRHIRDSARIHTPEHVARLAEVARDADVRLTLTPGSGGRVELAAFLQTLREVEAARPGTLAAVEGLNEVNNIFMHQSWNVEYNGQAADMCSHNFAPVKALQADLYHSVKADAALKGLPIYAYTVVALKKGLGDEGCRADYDADLRAIGIEMNADFANVHDYAFQGTPPREGLKKALTRPSPVSEKPAVITETGFSTGEAETASPRLSVSETVQAKYVLSALFDGFSLGAKRTYIYQLIDNSPDDPPTDLEKHYGLFHADGRPKPAARALHNLTRILADTDGRSIKTLPLDIRLKGPGAGMVGEKRLLMHKADGTYILALWAEPRIWNADSRKDVNVTPQRIDIGFGREVSHIAIYDPLKGVAPVERAANADMVTTKISDHPILIMFR